MTYQNLVDQANARVDLILGGREYDDCSLEEQSKIDEIVSFQAWKLRYSHNELSLPLSVYVRV